MPTKDFGKLEKVLRFGEGRRMKRLAEQAAYIGTLEPDFEQLSDADLAAKTGEFRQRLENGESLEELVFEAFAAVREAFKRRMGVRLFDVQLMGGIVLHEGDIAEMKTGEGKTFVAVQPLYLNALTGENVHLVTVNDYLAKRDPTWTKPVWDALGMRVGFIQNMMPFAERRHAYGADVTYGTNSEFGFDYLRDNMAVSLEGVVQRRHSYAIVDEVDSILIDEARTPLIISGEGEGTTERYVMADRVARQLKVDEHFEIKLKEHQCLLNEAGIERAEKLVGVESFYSNPAYMEWPHLLDNFFLAETVRAARRLRRLSADRDNYAGYSPRQGMPGIRTIFTRTRMKPLRQRKFSLMASRLN